MRVPPGSTLFPYTTLFRSSRRPQSAGSAAGRPACQRRARDAAGQEAAHQDVDRKSTRLNSSHLGISYAVFCLKKKTFEHINPILTTLLPDSPEQYNLTRIT